MNIIAVYVGYIPDQPDSGTNNHQWKLGRAVLAVMSDDILYLSSLPRIGLFNEYFTGNTDLPVSQCQ